MSSRSPATLLDLSHHGARVRLDRMLTVGASVELELRGFGSIGGRVVRRAADDEFGIHFADDPKERNELLRFIYARSDLAMQPTRWSWSACAAAVARRMLWA